MRRLRIRLGRLLIEIGRRLSGDAIMRITSEHRGSFMHVRADFSTMGVPAPTGDEA